MGVREDHTNPVVVWENPEVFRNDPAISPQVGGGRHTIRLRAIRLRAGGDAVVFEKHVGIDAMGVDRWERIDDIPPEFVHFAANQLDAEHVKDCSQCR